MSAFALTQITESDLPVPGTEPWFVDPEDSAATVMTDFHERSSVVVNETAHIDAALDHMKHAGVRCAFALNDQKRVVGLITSYDILGEAPTRHVQATAGRREQVLVRDIMQRLGSWQVADLTALSATTVGTLNKLFETTRLTHIPVVETAADGSRRLRGLLSAAKVRRLLSR